MSNQPTPSNIRFVTLNGNPPNGGLPPGAQPINPPAVALGPPVWVPVPMPIAHPPPPQYQPAPEPAPAPAPAEQHVTLKHFWTGAVPWLPSGATAPYKEETFRASTTVEALLNHYQCPNEPGYGVAEAELGRDERGVMVFRKGRAWTREVGGLTLKEAGFAVLEEGGGAMWLGCWIG